MKQNNSIKYLEVRWVSVCLHVYIYSRTYLHALNLLKAVVGRNRSSETIFFFLQVKKKHVNVAVT